MSWRDVMCGEPRRERVGRDADARRVGGAPTRPRRARLRRPARPDGRHAARRSTPSARPHAAELARRDPQRVRRAGAGRARRALARDRQPADADRRGRAAVDELTIVSRSTPLPFQLDEENVDETLPAALPLARPAPREAPAEPATARADGRDHPAPHGGRRVPRHPDADPLQVDARGRARLRRAEPPPQGAGSSRCRRARRSSSS